MLSTRYKMQVKGRAPSIVAEVVFRSNSLLDINDRNPYTGLDGRGPAILPHISQTIEPSGCPEAEARTLRHVHQLRDIRVQAMVEGSARARLSRAMNATTTILAQTLGLELGSEVDFRW